MKNNNKVLLAIIGCFLVCTIFVAVTARAEVGSGSSGEIIKYTKHVSQNGAQEFAVKDFSEMEILGYFQVVIKNGKKPSVSIAADEEALANIDLSQTNGKLSISPIHLFGKLFWKKVLITIVTNQPLKKINIGGASQIDYANINGNELVFATSGASKGYLSGKVNSLRIETSGASNIDAKDLVADEVNIEASGSAKIAVHAKSALKVELSGATRVDYYGKPTNIVRHTSGIASIKSAD